MNNPPSVAVAGVGELGVENLRHFQTRTSTQLLKDPSTEEIPADVDFIFITTDLSEPGTRGKLDELLQSTEAVTILFAEGLASMPDTLMEEVNLLVPIHLEIIPREFYPSFIADLFEAMLPRTVHDLGKGKIEIVAGENRIGKLYLHTPKNKPPAADLTPGVKYESPEYILFFHCSGERQPPGTIQAAIDEHQFSQDTPLVWDQRIHPRYIGKPHVKYLVTFDADDENVQWERDENVAEYREANYSIEDTRFIERKDE